MTKYIINQYDIIYGWLSFCLGIFVMFYSVINIYSDIMITFRILGLFLIMFGFGIVLYHYVEMKEIK